MILTIDTNAYSALKRGKKRVWQIMEEADRLVVPLVVVGELIAGFRNGIHTRSNLEALEQFLEEPDIELAAMNFAIADRYGKIVTDLRKKGSPIPTNDIWIAAVALENGARLLTADRHFDSIDGLMLYGYDE